MDYSLPGSFVHGILQARILEMEKKKNTRDGSHSLLQIFLTQGSNLCILNCRWILYCLSHQGSHEIKRRLLRGRKVMTNQDSELKSRHITLPTKVLIVKGRVFSKSWTMKAEPWWIDALELWCWRRLLRVLLKARRSNQSILEEINPEYSLEGLMLKLKLQYTGHLILRADSLEKTLTLRKIEGRRGWQRMTQLDGITDSMDMGLSKLREMVKNREAWHAWTCSWCPWGCKEWVTTELLNNSAT